MVEFVIGVAERARAVNLVFDEVLFDPEWEC